MVEFSSFLLLLPKQCVDSTEKEKCSYGRPFSPYRPLCNPFRSSWRKKEKFIWTDIFLMQECGVKGQWAKWGGGMEWQGGHSWWEKLAEATSSSPLDWQGPSSIHITPRLSPLSSSMLSASLVGWTRYGSNYRLHSGGTHHPLSMTALISVRGVQCRCTVPPPCRLSHSTANCWPLLDCSSRKLPTVVKVWALLLFPVLRYGFLLLWVCSVQ
jgi:hypothetical protein